MEKEYDYIIAGAGCAGLSLLMRMNGDPFFADKKILVVDAAGKNQNDRTWCFWEKEPDIFEPIVHHQWKLLDFFSDSFSGELQIAPYTYKMIEGLAFYNYVKKETAQNAHIHWLNETVLGLAHTSLPGIVLPGIVLKDRSIYASQVFNSILFEPIQPKPNQFYFKQHFKGWVIKTSQPGFDPYKATFMDFRVSQQHGTTFIYVLPTAADTALIEYTLFTEELLEQSEYEFALKQYISEYLQIDSYTIEHEEYGVIPMTNTRLPKADRGVVYIGIAGGQAKASSGYAFKFIQKRTAAIIRSLKTGSPVSAKSDFNASKGLLYDSVLLHVLHHRKMQGADIFSQIFKHNKASDVLAFLDNESTLFTDLKIMSSVPTCIFLPAALKEIGQLL